MVVEKQGEYTLIRFYLFPIFMPSPQEQQKIVDCLTTFDELITAEAGKLEAYKAHKKG
ncbi:restriction endonuclease subunit S [Candidatus Kuenenia sp.]|uniref:restriction endonuclease subunit S n=1 Tax=Candidatus Kuenenia sp. TaxID=2499824 RepID=UPI003AF6AAA0